MNQLHRVGILLASSLITLSPCAGAPADAVQDARSLGLSMVRDLKVAAKMRYFDPQFRGTDVDALFAGAEARVREDTINLALGRPRWPWAER